MTRGLATGFEEEHLSPGLALWRATNLWQAAQRAALKPLDLTHVQFVLLASLTWLDSDRPVTQSDLATHARTDAMMTSQVLRALESKCLVTRKPHPVDGRAFALLVTASGKSLANRAVQVVEGVDRRFFGVLTDHGASLAAELNEVIASFSAASEA